MNKGFEDDCISYSTSCVPPENSMQNEELKKIPCTVIKFPTLFGTSNGFTRVDEFWDKTILEKQRKIRHLKNFNTERDLNLSNAQSTNKIRSKSVNRFNKSSYNKIINEFNDELNNKVCYHNLPPSLPRDYNPRIDRNRSFNRSLLLGNRNNSNCDPDDYHDNVVFNFNSNNAETESEGDWINLYFEFPDGHKMKFKTRKRAMLKYAMEAFSARMGYSSIHDLKFLYNGKDIFYNETPISLQMFEDASIQVLNR